MKRKNKLVSQLLIFPYKYDYILYIYIYIINNNS